MTSVVGILNKRGLAIAADSAVTRTRSRRGNEEEKVTKNGNKMVRMSDVDPIAVMITGSADFLGVPWDVIVRRFRQRRGEEKKHYKSVEECVYDFFDYVASNETLWNDVQCNSYLCSLASGLFNKAMLEISFENDRNDDFTMEYPEEFVQAFTSILSRIAKEKLSGLGSPHFKGYSFDEFRRDAAETLDGFFLRYTDSLDLGAFPDTFPEKVLDAIRPTFEGALLAIMGSRMDNDSSARLVFAGYGKDEEYPSLVSALVCKGYARRVNYSVAPEDIICISDDRPVAICPFAQDDVMRAILKGMHFDWSEKAFKELDQMTAGGPDSVVYSMVPEEEAGYLYENLFSVNVEDLKNAFYWEGGQLFKENEHKWERGLERYNPEDLAVIADSFIDLTGLHRALTFQQEGVGGIVDLAVITKDEGFKWLRRKGWYHRDNHGKDGSMGI